MWTVFQASPVGAKPFTSITSLKLHTPPTGRSYGDLHFIDEETRAEEFTKLSQGHKVRKEVEFTLILNPPPFSQLQGQVARKPACSSHRDLVQAVFLAQSGGLCCGGYVVGAAWLQGCLPESSTIPATSCYPPPRGSRVGFTAPVVRLGARQLQLPHPPLSRASRAEDAEQQGTSASRSSRCASI